MKKEESAYQQAPIDQVVKAVNRSNFSQHPTLLPSTVTIEGLVVS